MGEGKGDSSKVGDHNKGNVCSGNSKKLECRVMFKVYFIVRLLLQPPQKFQETPHSFLHSSKASMTITLLRGGHFLALLLSTAKAKHLPRVTGAVY